MPNDLQARRRIGAGLLSLVLAGAPVPAPLAGQLPAPTGTPATGTPPEAAWFQTLATLLGPTLTTAIHQSRDRAYSHGRAIPEAIRRTLAPFFPRTLLEKVRYSTAWQEAPAQDPLARVLLGSGATAVTLIDVILFRDEQQAADPLLWAHELTHVEQYERLGVDTFVTQYLQHAWVLEHEAMARADAIKGQLSP